MPKYEYAPGTMLVTRESDNEVKLYHYTCRPESHNPVPPPDVFKNPDGTPEVRRCAKCGGEIKVICC